MNFLFYLLLLMLPIATYGNESYCTDSQHPVLFQIVEAKNKLNSVYLPIEASLLVTEDNKPSLIAKLPISKIRTGNAEIDNQLAVFSTLNTDFEYARFVSHKMVFTDTNNVNIYGNIALFNFELPVILHAHLNKIKLSSLSQNTTLFFNATTIIDAKQLPVFLLKQYSGHKKIHIKMDARMQGVS